MYWTDRVLSNEVFINCALFCEGKEVMRYYKSSLHDQFSKAQFILELRYLLPSSKSRCVLILIYVGYTY
jgi:hypothetical protein